MFDQPFVMLDFETMGLSPDAGDRITEVAALRIVDGVVAERYVTLVNCGGMDLFSFAAITDEPAPEIADARHDRCIIPIKSEHMDGWLNPDPDNLAVLYAILEDKARPHFVHRRVV